MRTQFLFFILTFSLFGAFSQENKSFSHSKYENLDSVVQFQKGINEYKFLWSNYQGFSWGEISQKTDCRFNILNDTEDTIFINRFQSDDPILQYNKTAYSNINEGKQSLHNAILPNQLLCMSVHLRFKPHVSEFQKDFKIEYFVDGKKGIFNIPTWGNFIKVEDIPAETEIRKKETISFELILPAHKPISDLVFVKWNGTRTEKYFPTKFDDNTYKFIIQTRQHDSLLYGMFYCERYQVICKVKQELTANYKTLKLSVNYLFENRNDYFYSDYGQKDSGVINPKRPFNSQSKLYKLSWSYKPKLASDTIIAYREDVKSYLNSLGYNRVDRIYEPNKSKAIQLERELKNSKYHISMFPYEFSDSILSKRDWVSTYYKNSFEIRFSENVSDEWITALFKKYQILDFRKFEQEIYIFSFNYIVSRSYMRILDKIWQLKEVEYIEQIRTTQNTTPEPY